MKRKLHHCCAIKPWLGHGLRSHCSFSLVLLTDRSVAWKIFTEDTRGGGVCAGSSCLAAMCACVSVWRRRGQAGNDEVIAKERGKWKLWKGGRRGRLEEWHWFRDELSCKGVCFLPPSPCSPDSAQLGRCQCFVVTARESLASVEWTRRARGDAGSCWHGGRFVFLELLLSQAVETG